MTKLPLPLWLEGVARARAGLFQTEAKLQAWADCELRSHIGFGDKAPHTFERELILPDDAGRIDFAVSDAFGRWGIECKVKASPNTWRQLARYAPHFDHLILVTTWAHGEPPEEFETPHGNVRLYVLDLWKNL